MVVKEGIWGGGVGGKMVGWSLAYTPADRPPAAFNLDTILLLGKGRGGRRIW